MSETPPSSPKPIAEDHYVRRVVIAVSVVAAFGAVFWLLHAVGHGILIVLAGILVGILLDGLVRLVPLPRFLSFLLVLVGLLAALAGISWWLGSSIVEQLAGIEARVTEAWPRVETWLRESSWGRRGLEQLSKMAESQDFGGRASDLLVTVVGGIGTVVLIPVFGVFFAASPRLYVSSLVDMFPIPRRPRVGQVLAAVGRALRSWFVGRLVSMTVVGLGTGIGLWIADVPMAAGLGLIAGMLSFIPNIGPLLAAAPGILVGLSTSPTTAFWALVVYVAVQAVDNYLVTPLVDFRAVDIPPAGQLGAQLLLGLLAGGLGIFMATPLVVVVVVLIQAFYIQDTLGDPVPLLADRRAKGKAKAKEKLKGRS